MGFMGIQYTDHITGYTPFLQGVYRRKQWGMAYHSGTEGFVARLNRAVAWLGFQTGDKISQKKLGDLVGAELRRKTPVDQGDVWAWFNGSLPKLRMVEAIARACGVRPGWLAFGEEPMQEGGLPGTPTPIELNPPPRTPAAAAKPAASMKKVARKKRGPSDNA